MAYTSTRARPPGFWLVIGLAVLCLILTVMVVQRRNGGATPSQPVVAASVTPQLDNANQSAGQIGSSTGSLNQGTSSTNGLAGQRVPDATPAAPIPPTAMPLPDATATLWPVTNDP